MRSFVALFRTPTKGVSIDPNATEGAIVGENLFIRQTNGELALFEPSDGTVTPAVGNAIVVTLSAGGVSTTTQNVAGSNGGYAAAISPAAAPSNYDLDASMIAGLNNPQFPTLNYILVGNGTQWVAVPMSGDAAILASGAINVSTVSKTATASGTNTYAATLSPVPTGYFTKVVYTITFTNANTAASTLNLNTLGAKAIQLRGAALTGGEIPAGATVSLLYDGTQFQIIGASSGTSPTSWNVHQVAHGFVVGNVVHNGTSAWAKANNGTTTLTADAIVSAVAGADDFTLQQFGTLTLTTGQWDAVCGTTGGLTQGNYYWVDSTAGKMTPTQPSGASNFQQVCITAMSTTYAEVLLPSDAILSVATAYSADESTLTLTGTVFSEKDGGTTNTKLANMAAHTVKANITGSSAAPTDVVMGSLLGVVQGRLTTESGVPVSTSERTAQTTIYFTPYKGNLITLWDGTTWFTLPFTEQTLALGTVTAALCYDVFGFLSGGALAIEKLAWTSATARATAVTLQDGRYCKSGDKTRLYLGTFYTSSTTTTEDFGGGVTTNVGGQRYVWNYYNRCLRYMAVTDTTTTWAYATNTIRQAHANATSGNKVEVVIGFSEDHIPIDITSSVQLASNTVHMAGVGVGLNSTTTFQGGRSLAFNTSASNQVYSLVNRSLIVMPIGYSYLAWNEVGATVGTCTFYGANDTNGLSGLQAQVWA